MFRAERPRIRDVDVEIVPPGDNGAVEPTSDELPGDAVNNGAERRSLRGLRWKRGAPPTSSVEPELDGMHLNGSGETVRDVEVEMIEAVETPRTTEPTVTETAIAETPAIEFTPPTDATPDAEVETHDLTEAASDIGPEEPSRPVEPVVDGPVPAKPEPAETPRAAEAERASDSTPEVRPPVKPSPKTRVVWSSAAAGVQRAHTLKLTKPAPSRGFTETPATKHEPVARPPVEKPRSAAPPPAAAPPASELVRDAATEAKPAVQRLEPEPAAYVEPMAHEAPAAPAPAAREQTCDILFWRGYRKAAFYGRTFDETGEAVAVAESPFFRPQGNGAPEPTEAAKTAYDALRSQLIAAGWEPVSAGDVWFDETFRLTGAPEQEPE